MTLADEILNANFTPVMAFGPSLSQFQRDVRQAQKFCFEPAAVEAVINLLHSKQTSFLEAARLFAHAPYELTWLEWLTPAVVPLGPGQLRTQHTGVLIQQVKPYQFFVSTAWDYPDAVLREQEATRNPALQGFVAISKIGWSQVRAEVNFHDQPLGSHHIWELATNPKEREAQHALERAIGFHVVVDLEKPRDDMLIKPGATRGIGPLAMLQMKLGHETAMAKLVDVAQEVKPAIGMLILLSSRNCVSTHAVEPPAQLNKARAKRGRLPLVSYTNVSISLGRRDSRQASAHGVSAEDIRQHLVRGHFKIRKTGVYWWRNHIRGAAAAGARSSTRVIE